MQEQKKGRGEGENNRETEEEKTLEECLRSVLACRASPSTRPRWLIDRAGSTRPAWLGRTLGSLFVMSSHHPSPTPFILLVIRMSSFPGISSFSAQHPKEGREEGKAVGCKAAELN
jgi:hypothetical protein